MLLNSIFVVVVDEYFLQVVIDNKQEREIEEEFLKPIP